MTHKEIVDEICAHIDKALMEAIDDWQADTTTTIRIQVRTSEGWTIDISVGDPGSRPERLTPPERT